MYRHFDKCLDLGGLFFIPQFKGKAHRREEGGIGSGKLGLYLQFN